MPGSMSSSVRRNAPKYLIENRLELAMEDEFLSDIGLSLIKFRSSRINMGLRPQLSALDNYSDAWIIQFQSRGRCPIVTSES